MFSRRVALDTYFFRAWRGKIMIITHVLRSQCILRKKASEGIFWTVRVIARAIMALGDRK